MLASSRSPEFRPHHGEGARGVVEARRRPVKHARERPRRGEAARVEEAAHLALAVGEVDEQRTFDPVERARHERALDGIDGPLFVDLADSKREVRSFLDASGFAAVRPFTRMLYGSSVRFDNAARTFAVVGPEFG